MSDCTCGLGFTPATIKKRTKWVKDLQIELEAAGLPGTATWVGGDFRPTTPDKGMLIMVLLPNGRVVHPTSPAHYEYAEKHKKGVRIGDEFYIDSGRIEGTHSRRHRR